MQVLFNYLPQTVDIFKKEKTHNLNLWRNIGMLQLAEKYDHPVDELIHNVVYNRDVDSLEWVISKGVEFSNRCLTYAIKSKYNDLDYIKWVCSKIPPKKVNWKAQLAPILVTGNVQINEWYLSMGWYKRNSTKNYL